METFPKGHTHHQKCPTAYVERVINAPVKEVWNLIRKFGQWTKWSPIYNKMKMIQKGKEKANDVIGAERRYETLDGSVFEEILVERDTKNHTIVYDFKSLSSKHPKVAAVQKYVHAIRTVVSLEEVQLEHKVLATKIVWSSVTELVPGIPQQIHDMALEHLAHLQKETYKVEIKALRQYCLVHSMYVEVYNYVYSKHMGLTKALLTGHDSDSDEEGNATGGNWAYDDYTFVSDDGELLPLPRMVKGLPESQAISPHKLGQMFARLAEALYLQAHNEVEKIRTAQNGCSNHDDHERDIPKNKGQIADKIDRIKTYGENTLQLVSTYGDVPKNQEEKENDQRERPFFEMTKRLLATWESDEEFCQQLLQGVNPTVIKVVTNINQVPIGMQGLTAIKLKNKTKTKIETVKDLIEDKRLFILDYAMLSKFKIIPQLPQTYFSDPVMLVYRKFSSQDLGVLGIQLTHDPNGPVYTPNMEHKNRYRLARMFAACADNQVHEFGYHLGFSHLTFEPMIVAAHNTLRDHPMGDFLIPHFEDTIGINFMAREILITADDDESFDEAITNKTFALGTKQGVRLMSNLYQEFDFMNSSFPRSMETRGFNEKKDDGLERYYYRDDGYLVWNAIGTYTTNFVHALYDDDAALQKDKTLQAWVTEMTSEKRANIRGFPKDIPTRELLSTALQIIIWNVSAFHWAISGPQWPYLGFSPNRPNAVYAAMPPEDGKDITDDQFQQALLPDYPGAFQLTFSWLLTLPAETKMTSLPNLRAPNDPELNKKLLKVSEDFRKELKGVTKKIEDRNSILPKGAEYIFLIPENVASSVAI